MLGRSIGFSHAVTRKPGPDIVRGLRAVDTGTPDLDVFQAHHDDYVAALRSTGAEVRILDPLDGFADAVFVEDTALCLPEGVVMMRPGAPSRLGETVSMRDVMAEYYGEPRDIEAPARIEGGDILTTETEILVGLSERTDMAGVEALRTQVADWGYTVRVLETPPGVLHFKTDCSLLDEETILSTRRLASAGCFDGYRVVETADGEEACANSIRFNNLVIMPAGFPKTAEKMRAMGYEVREVGNTEAAKLDGGMSCLSLRFSPRAAD